MSIMGFLRYNKLKYYTIQAWMYCALYRVLICLIPARYLEKSFGMRGAVTSSNMTSEEYRTAVKVSHAVNWVANKTPWKSKCMVRALAAQRILFQKHIPTTLYLGVGKDDTGKMQAHAWIRYGSYYITGGSREDIGRYAVVETFVKQ